MAVCNLLDFRCIFVNELIGNVALAMVFLTMLWFVFASKIKLGFRATVMVTIPLLLISSLAITDITIVSFFAVIFVGILLASIFIKTVEGK